MITVKDKRAVAEGLRIDEEALGRAFAAVGLDITPDLEVRIRLRDKLPKHQAYATAQAVDGLR